VTPTPSFNLVACSAPPLQRPTHNPAPRPTPNFPPNIFSHLVFQTLIPSYYHRTTVGTCAPSAYTQDDPAPQPKRSPSPHFSISTTCPVLHPTPSLVPYPTSASLHCISYLMLGNTPTPTALPPGAQHSSVSTTSPSGNPNVYCCTRSPDNISLTTVPQQRFATTTRRMESAMPLSTITQPGTSFARLKPSSDASPTSDASQLTQPRCSENISVPPTVGVACYQL
jgi:hypothetical protein